MVKKNEYPRKDNFSKDGGQAGEPANTNSQQKTFQRNGEGYHKENHVRTNRPPRDYQQRDNGQQKEGFQREPQKRENNSRDNQARENSTRENTSRDNNQQHKEHQRNYHRDNNQNKEVARENNREQREPYRPHFQRSAIKPRAEETVEDIAADIVRIEKEIELELKEIKSMRLGV